MTTKEKPNLFFRKKVYASIYKPTLFGEGASSKLKKIVSSPKKSGLREEFKKVFLPLLIDVFELRKRVQNYKLNAKSPFDLKTEISCPGEILQKLTELQLEIEESRRWCEGVILQISKGIDEAKEALQFIDKMSDKSCDDHLNFSLKKRLRKFFRKNDRKC